MRLILATEAKRFGKFICIEVNEIQRIGSAGIIKTLHRKMFSQRDGKIEIIIVAAEIPKQWT